MFLFFFTMAIMVVISMFTPKAGSEQLAGTDLFFTIP